MFTENREQYLAMLNKVERGEIDAIVVLRLDRLGRDLADMTMAIKLLNAYGCALLAGDDISNNNTAIGELMRGILLCQNQYQARATANSVMEGEIHNAQNGDSAGGQPPYGLSVVSKHFVLNEDEAPAVKLIFEMASKGKSYKQIIEKLTSLGYKTRKKRPFTYSTLNSLLRNDKYYGTYVYNRENGKRRKDRVLLESFEEIRNENAIPPIITKELFDKVQKMLDKRKSCRPRQNANPSYILTGVLECGCCGSSISGQSTVSGRNKKRTRQYGCLNHSAKRGSTCATKAVNAEYLENAIKNLIVDAINLHLSNKDTSKKIFEVLKKTKSKELAALEKNIVRS
jgi:site-specific DNA recombinase